jgi:hypothetical protein
MDMSLFDRLVGRPLASAEEPVQRVKVPKGVAVSGLDALGSVASRPEAALTVLIPAGTCSFDVLEVEIENPRRKNGVVFPRLVAARWYQQFLYNYSRGSPDQTAFRQKKDVSRSSKSFGDCLRHRPGTM